MSKKILTIGLELADPDSQFASFSSKMSLLDWDIVLFKPEIGEFFSLYGDSYQGKPCLSDSSSFRLKEYCEHWRREIKQALDAGKTIIIYLPPLLEVYVDTGERTYSGSGRNQKTTRHVELYSNYHAIPARLSPVISTGNAMKLVDRGAEVLAQYWSEFEAASKYQVLLTHEDVKACMVTRVGGKAVGALYRSKASNGALLLLPDIEFYAEGFLKEVNDEQTWTKAALQFSGRFISTIVALDKALKSALEVTPEPSWASENRFVLASEDTLRGQLLEVEMQIEQSQKKKEKINEALVAAGGLRGVLYEKGKPLESSIIDALRILGFKAESYKQSDSEFDVVFESSEGRLIGEAEGKDNKAVNIDKLRQLSMNIHEDLQREKVSTPAKPVLFGNGYRLQPLQDRADPFTEKCHSASTSSSTALVFTADLFPPVQYLLKTPDSDYAQACRKAILSATGRVSFPVPPTLVDPDEIIVDVQSNE